MCNKCPKSCGGLATAAAFIAAGTVQLIAGLILLRSKYVYMLSGPDFWTATANLSVGCLLGIVASIWKHPRRHRTVVIIARYNLIAALLVSSITVNVTTCAILILSEGSTLLSIQLERDGKDGIATLNSEMLGYAYAASVISPALCIVLSVASLLARCCPAKAKKRSKKFKLPKKIRKKCLCGDNHDRFHWVFTTPEQPNHDTLPEPEPEISPLSSDSEFDISSATPSLAFSSPTRNNRCQFASIKRPITHLDANDLNISRRIFNDSELSGHSFFDQTLNTTPAPSMVGDVVPVHLGRTISTTSYPLGLPVSSPVVPVSWNAETIVKTPVFSTSTKTPRVFRSPIERNYNFGKKRSSFTSFHNDKLKTDFLKQCPQIEQIRTPHLRGETMGKLFPMDSIAEDTNDDQRQNDDLGMTTSPSRTSGYGSSPDIIINSCGPRIPAVDYLRNDILRKEPAIKKSLFPSTRDGANDDDSQELRL